MEIAEIKDQWTGFTFDTVEVKVESEDLAKFAHACGETEPRYVDREHPDFQASPTYTSRYHGRRMMPDNFPKIGSGYGFDAGKTVFPQHPIRPGDVLTGQSKVHDIYEKTGRSGSMVFIVHRMEFSNQDGQVVSIVDSRMMQRAGGPKKDA